MIRGQRDVGMDCSKMLAAADETYRRNLYGDTSALFGVSKDKL